MIETILISVIALAWVPAVVLGARYMATGYLCAARSLRPRAANAPTIRPEHVLGETPRLPLRS